jgi:long-chain acyl-CoA synthetase
VLNGWGLTETSPVLACRSARGGPGANVRGSVGRPVPGTEIKIVHPDTKEEVADGTQGLLLARGPGVTRGYWGDQNATSAAFWAGERWFDTGDLGWRCPQNVPGSAMAGCIVLTGKWRACFALPTTPPAVSIATACLFLPACRAARASPLDPPPPCPSLFALRAGRAKDTIVLTSGENVEPQPLEDAIACSRYVKTAVLVGHGHRALGALLVPDEEALAELVTARGALRCAALRRAACIPPCVLHRIFFSGQRGTCVARGLACAAAPRAPRPRPCAAHGVLSLRWLIDRPPLLCANTPFSRPIQTRPRCRPRKCSTC